MFEKEAEKYREEWQNKGYYFVSQEMEQIELDDIVDATFKDGAEFGYNKANEWHKADEKPKVTKEYLVYLISGYNCRSVTMMIYNAERGFWCANNQNDVVYWKEIVLPELSKYWDLSTGENNINKENE